MINPEYKPRWRPETDFVSRPDLQPNYLPLEAYVPTDAADALAYLKELALPELVAYDGDPIQTELMKEMAAAQWSNLFPEVVITEPIVRQPTQGVSHARI